MLIVRGSLMVLCLYAVPFHLDKEGDLLGDRRRRCLVRLRFPK